MELKPYTSVEELQEDLVKHPLNKAALDEICLEGICVTFTKLQNEGYHIAYQIGSPEILVKDDSTPKEQDITILHEIFHILLNKKLGKTVKISNPIYSQLDSIIDGEAQTLYKAEPWMVAYIKERAKI